MRRLRRISERAASKLDEPHLSIAPLIDVCFLLIIYFMVTTTIVPGEKDLRTAMGSEVPTTDRIPSRPITVKVQADGVIVLHPGRNEVIISRDPEDRDLEDLQGFLETVMVGVKELPHLVVKAEGATKHQRVVDVMNVCGRFGWTSVGFVDDE